jgi:hypothetical protein
MQKDGYSIPIDVTALSVGEGPILIRVFEDGDQGDIFHKHSQNYTSRDRHWLEALVANQAYRRGYLII